MPLVEPGKKAPAFSLPDQEGNVHRLADYAGRPVVLFFYPKDDTPGCTKEACAFRDNLPRFKASKAAWDWFSSQPPGYRRTAIWFVVSAVKAETQAKRLQRLIEMSNERRRIIGPSGLGAVKPAR